MHVGRQLDLQEARHSVTVVIGCKSQSKNHANFVAKIGVDTAEKETSKASCFTPSWNLVWYRNSTASQGFARAHRQARDQQSGREEVEHVHENRVPGKARSSPVLLRRELEQ